MEINMSQGRNSFRLQQKASKGFKGFPIATIASYGPTNAVATKLVCGIVKSEGAEPEPMQKWFSDSDVRQSEEILGEVSDFIKENKAKTVGMTGDIIGCPHEEGIDYPDGEHCPICPYWEGRDRFTHEMLD